MSDAVSYELLGLDNALLPVGNLGEAVGFYERAGFPPAFRLDEAGIALPKVGKETPGVPLRLDEELSHRPPPWASPRLWLEVPDARGGPLAGRRGHHTPRRALLRHHRLDRRDRGPLGQCHRPDGLHQAPRTGLRGPAIAPAHLDAPPLDVALTHRGPSAADPFARSDLNMFKSRSTFIPDSVFERVQEGVGTWISQSSRTSSICWSASL